MRVRTAPAFSRVQPHFVGEVAVTIHVLPLLCPNFQCPDVSKVRQAARTDPRPARWVPRQSSTPSSTRSSTSTGPSWPVSRTTSTRSKTSSSRREPGRVAPHLRPVQRGHRVPASDAAADRGARMRSTAGFEKYDVDAELQRNLRDVSDHCHPHRRTSGLLSSAAPERAHGADHARRSTSERRDAAASPRRASSQNEEVKKISAWAAICSRQPGRDDLRHELRRTCRAPLVLRIPDRAGTDGGHLRRLYFIFKRRHWLSRYRSTCREDRGCEHGDASAGRRTVTVPTVNEDPGRDPLPPRTQRLSRRTLLAGAVASGWERLSAARPTLPRQGPPVWPGSFRCASPGRCLIRTFRREPTPSPRFSTSSCS